MHCDRRLSTAGNRFNSRLVAPRFSKQYQPYRRTGEGAQTSGFAATLQKLICWASCVAKRYCVTYSIGDTFEQCRLVTPESRPAIGTTPSGGRWDRPELHLLLDQLRKGDVLNALSTLARLRFQLLRPWSGNSIGCLGRSAMRSRLWSGSGKRERDSAI